MYMHLMADLVFIGASFSTCKDWLGPLNYITNQPKIDPETYRIIDDESIWKGKGQNPDGSTCDLGLYDGEYSWEK